MALKWILANDANDRIDKGQITINQNTTFTGDATFLSKGTDESITINAGSIVFRRNNVPLTTIKNIRFGSVTTDYTGKGRVSFQGFKKPILILPSIRSYTTDSNIASLYCYAEEVDASTNTYKFVISGTSEYHTPPTDIKVMSKVATFENSISHNWKDFGVKYVGKNLGKSNFRNYRRNWHYYPSNDSIKFIRLPQYKIQCKRTTIDINTQKINESIIFEETKNISVICDRPNYGRKFWHWSDSEIYSELTYTLRTNGYNIGKVFNSLIETVRSNVKLEILITITQSDLEHDAIYTKAYEPYYETTLSGEEPRKTISNFLTINDFIEYFITYSSETSQISKPRGEGEVQYIAMEIE